MGRKKGGKNAPGHNAGGARKGAGRPRKDGSKAHAREQSENIDPALQSQDNESGDENMISVSALHPAFIPFLSVPHHIRLSVTVSHVDHAPIQPISPSSQSVQGLQETDSQPQPEQTPILQDNARIQPANLTQSNQPLNEVQNTSPQSSTQGNAHNQNAALLRALNNGTRRPQGSINSPLNTQQVLSPHHSPASLSTQIPQPSHSQSQQQYLRQNASVSPAVRPNMMPPAPPPQQDMHDNHDAYDTPYSHSQSLSVEPQHYPSPITPRAPVQPMQSPATVQPSLPTPPLMGEPSPQATRNANPPPVPMPPPTNSSPHYYHSMAQQHLQTQSVSHQRPPLPNQQSHQHHSQQQQPHPQQHQQQHPQSHQSQPQHQPQHQVQHQPPAQSQHPSQHPPQPQPHHSPIADQTRQIFSRLGLQLPNQPHQQQSYPSTIHPPPHPNHTGQPTHPPHTVHPSLPSIPIPSRSSRQSQPHQPLPTHLPPPSNQSQPGHQPRPPHQHSSSHQLHPSNPPLHSQPSHPPNPPQSHVPPTPISTHAQQQSPASRDFHSLQENGEPRSIRIDRSNFPSAPNQQMPQMPPSHPVLRQNNTDSDAQGDSFADSQRSSVDGSVIAALKGGRQRRRCAVCVQKGAVETAFDCPGRGDRTRCISANSGGRLAPPRPYGTEPMETLRGPRLELNTNSQDTEGERGVNGHSNIITTQDYPRPSQLDSQLRSLVYRSAPYPTPAVQPPRRPEPTREESANEYTYSPNGADTRVVILASGQSGKRRRRCYVCVKAGKDGLECPGRGNRALCTSVLASVKARSMTAVQ